MSVFSFFRSQHEEIDLISEDEVFSASEMPVSFERLHHTKVFLVSFFSP